MSEYKDSDGNKIDLYRLINKEPEWAVNIIEKLQAENKDLKEIMIRAAKYACEQFKAIEASRDELLEAVEQSEIVFRMNKDFDRAEMLVPIIKRAKVLKGETK